MIGRRSFSDGGHEDGNFGWERDTNYDVNDGIIVGGGEGVIAELNRLSTRECKFGRGDEPRLSGGNCT